jgi:hypothetical protein
VSIDSDLSDALTRRLNLQISVSRLPVVEEWMDTRLGRWLDSVPLPPELTGPPVQFLVAVATDLSRLRWSAAADPSGVIPKLAGYLSQCKVSEEEIELINEVGGRLEPEMVGSWIEISNGDVHTGWQMLDREDVGEVFDLIGEAGDGGELGARVAGSGLSRVTRIARRVTGGYQIDLELTGAPEEDALVVAAGALEKLGHAVELPTGEYVNRDLAQTRIVAVMGDNAAPGEIGVRFGASSDQVAALCGAVGVAYDPELDAVRKSLQSAGIQGAVLWVRDGAVCSIDVELAPGTQRGVPSSPN